MPCYYQVSFILGVKLKQKTIKSVISNLLMYIIVYVQYIFNKSRLLYMYIYIRNEYSWNIVNKQRTVLNITTIDDWIVFMIRMFVQTYVRICIFWELFIYYELRILLFKTNFILRRKGRHLRNNHYLVIIILVNSKNDL